MGMNDKARFSASTVTNPIYEGKATHKRAVKLLAEVKSRKNKTKLVPHPTLPRTWIEKEVT